MRQRLGALRRHVDVLEDAAHGGVFGNERDYLHLGATKRAQQRINLINLLDKGGPGEPGAAAEGLVIGGGQGGGAGSGGEALIVRCGGKREASWSGAAFAA